MFDSWILQNINNWTIADCKKLYKIQLIFTKIKKLIMLNQKH